LQWRLNGLEDRTRTPLEWMHGVFTGSRRASRALAGQRWSPLVYECGGIDAKIGVGFISTGNGPGNARMIATLGSLPEDSPLRAEEVTIRGSRSVRGRLTAQSRLDTHSAPIYLYRLTA
jgi:hypothetical protein